MSDNHISKEAKLAQQQLDDMYLSIPASLAPIEIYFSTAGKIMRQDRAHLLPHNFEKLLFLKVNSCLY